MKQRKGFTLLEVMIAVAILGLGLTAILAAQAGSFSMSAHARNISVVTGLARCKMGELEEVLQKPDGFQELDVIESGPCCEGDETPNVSCTWKIEKPTFPDPVYGEMELDTGLDIGGSPGGGLPGMPGMPGMPGGGGLDPASLGDGGLPGDPTEMLGSLLKEGMRNAYPTLKSIFENSTRRITVTVTWKQGEKEQSFDLVQWFTRPPTQGIDEDALDGGGPNG
ncbi:type IV pilus modification PilV family protein [Polyangium spumosum]|uniref:Prepilin-type N-terminal cleavage/methylation domain-containing protein n=1 Tax=Polyangium spumosum TaxID=889282 RepID=A0A6N7PQQ2_9BACT|nr:prepilin-type N-terminal cleavage/methylation domain-containing protein [Polyangium spumosum]MRG93957.1 prepilin-type N-terminal cleavage/methylation domain-containing protein [Polyangium spumosum]